MIVWKIKLLASVAKLKAKFLLYQKKENHKHQDNQRCLFKKNWIKKMRKNLMIKKMMKNQ